MLQAHQAVVAGQKLHLLHVSRFSSTARFVSAKMGSQLVLGRSHLVVLGLRGNAQRPQLIVELLHELVHRGANGAEVVLLQLLALHRRIAEQRAAREHDVEALLIVLLGDEEVLLLGARVVVTRSDESSPNRSSTRRPWVSMAFMERRSGVFLSSASPV